jgi:hypothetical protein
MLEKAVFPLPYYSPSLQAHFSSLTVYESEGNVFIDGQRNPHFPSSYEVQSQENVSHSLTWLLKAVDISNPLLDRELCEFWKTSDLPLPVKNAVEEIAYQHRRMISASGQWASCEASAKAQNVHPFNQPLTFGQYQTQRKPVSGFCFLRPNHLIQG